MFRKCRKVVAVAVACVLITGIAAYAQTQGRVKNQDPAARQQKMQQRRDAMAAPEGRMQKQVRARFGSLQGILVPPDPQVIEKLAARLGLNDEQKQQIKQLYVQFVGATRPVREQRMADLKAFMTAFKDPKVTKGDLERLSEPILRADKAILDAEFDFWLGFRAILNPQQQAQLQSYMMEQAGKDLGAPPTPPRKDRNPVAPAQ